MRKDDRVRLQHMRDAAKDALSFAAGRFRGDLDTDRMLTLSLLKCIEIVGEAANRISAELQGQHPQIPWPDIIGMRNRLVHTYYDVDLNILWRTVEENLPGLVADLEKVLA